MYMQVNGVSSVFNSNEQNQQLICQKTPNTGLLKFRALPSCKKDKFKFLYRSPELVGNAIIPMLSQCCAPANVYPQYSTYILSWILLWLHGFQTGANSCLTNSEARFICTCVIGVSSGTFTCQSSYPTSVMIF